MSEFEDLYNLYYKDVFYYVLSLTDYQEYIAEELFLMLISHHGKLWKKLVLNC